jgi:hypothetical protein
MTIDTPPQDAPETQQTSEVQQAQEALNVALSIVNLDELVIDTIDVAIVERVKVEAKKADGTTVTRYKHVPRTAQIAALVSTDTQLRVFKQFQDLEHATQEDQAAFMYECVLDVWQETEPDMTLDELKHCGLDITRIAALFQRLFTPASRA